MNNQLGSFLAATDKAACSWFGQYGGALQTLGYALVMARNPLSATVGGGLMLANAAAEMGCDYDPNTSASGDPVPGINGCAETDGGADLVCYYGDGGIAGIPLPASSGTNKILSVTEGTNSDGSANLRIDVSDINGNDGWIYAPNYDKSRGYYVALEPVAPVKCLDTKDDTKPRLKPDDLPVVDYKDPETGCEMNITFKGYAEGPGGSVYQIQQIEAAAETRADGGRVGGCFFNPTIVVRPIGGGGGGGGGGPIDNPPITIPVPSPDPGDDWWKPYVKAAIQGVVAGAVEEIIENILNRPYSDVIYRAVSVCEKDADGEDISEAVEIPIAALKAPDAQIARLDAIAELLQAHKNFKQPVCNPDDIEPEGDFRTISFRSQETSPYGKSRLRKRLRYRGKPSVGLDALIDYWKDFQWESGPVRVRHTGSSWGTPEVWAASEDEGKRVLRHAAGEAGIDPDQIGRWSTRRSNSARLGVSGIMNVDTTGGFYWITERDGSNHRPDVALTSNQLSGDDK